MKKTTKKLLTLALSTLFIGAGVGSVAVWHNNAKLLASAAAPDGSVAFDSYLTLEEAKVKNITDWSYVNEDGTNIWRFNGEGGQEANPEIRFITDGTQTENKPYTFAPVSITGFSFDYRMENWDIRNVADVEANFIVQILASDGTYPIFIPTIDNESYEWNTLSFDLTSACTWNGAAATLADVKDLFSGFIFKMGGLNGTVDIANINVTLAEVADPEPEEPAVPAKTFIDLTNYMSFENAHSWGPNGDYTEAPLYRFRSPSMTDAQWSGNFANDYLRANTTILDNVYVNGKSIAQHNADYKALVDSGEASPITWTGMPANEGAPSASGKYMQSNIAEDVNNGTAYFAPIFINLCNHGEAYGSSIDMYIPTSYLAPEEVQSVKITKDFVFETETHKFGFSEDVEIISSSLRMPIKIVGERPQYTILPTDLQKINGTHNGDSFFCIYPTANDYAGANTTPMTTVWDDELLKRINFFDYVLIDGVKMGTLWNNVYPGEKFFNVWGRSNSFAIRWPTALNNVNSINAVQEIKILKGFQLPAYTSANTLYEVQEDTTFICTQPGMFIAENYTFNADDVTISEAYQYGTENELWAIEMHYANWKLIDGGHHGNANYFSVERIFGRQNILVNGVSLWDINANTDDSNYVYATGDWTHADIDPSGNYPYQVHQNPTRLVIGDGGEHGDVDQVTLYIHKDYVESIGGIANVEITFNKGCYIYDAGQDYVAGETFTVEVPAPKYTVTVITGNPRMNPESVTTAEYEHGAAFSVDTPVAEGKTFVGWIDVNGNPVTVPETITAPLTIYASWDVTPYTLTIVNGNDITEFVFGVEAAGEIMLTPADLAYVLEDNLPVDESGEYEYAYVDLPQTFGLQDYTINVEATKVKFWLTVITGNPRVNPEASVSTLHAEGDAISVAEPTAEGKTFAGWIDVNSNAVTVPATMPAEDMAIYANWNITPYTLTIVNGEETTEFVFGVEAVGEIMLTPADLAYVLEDNLPAATEDYTYAYAEAMPDAFGLEDYTFNVVATEVIHVPADGSTLTIEEVLALDIEAAAGNKYYVEGTVVRYSDTYKGGLYIQDAEGNEICIYGLKKVYPADEWSDGYEESFMDMWYEDKPLVGATVKFYGEVGAYKGVNQFVDAEFEILAQPAEDPEAHLPEDGMMLSIAEVLAMNVTGDTLRMYYVEGKVVEIANTKYGNLYIEDNDGNRLYVYGLYDLWTGARFDSMEDQPEVGEIVSLKSIVSVYNGAIQLKNARLTECRPAPIELNLEGETVIDIAAGNAEEYEYVYVNAVAYTEEPNAMYTISWDASVTNLMVNYGMVQNGGVVEAYEGELSLNFYADDFAALTVTVTLTPYVAPPLPELVVGDNTIEVTNGWEGTKVQVSVAGTYVLEWAADELNGVIMVEDEYGSEMLELPYTFTVAEGEVFVMIVMTGDWSADEVNVVMTLVHDCVDGEYDKRDHVCDICGEVISECADADNNHKCDVCYAPLSECVDSNNDHKCEVCGQAVSGCTDADKNHACDVCGKTTSEHNYEGGVCLICGAEDPTTPEEPSDSTDSTDSTDSEEPADDEEKDPSILDKVTGLIPDQVKNVIPGCSGVVGGIAGGVAALGIAVVALLKKKEDNE